MKNYSTFYFLVGKTRPLGPERRPERKWWFSSGVSWLLWLVLLLCLVVVGLNFSLFILSILAKKNARGGRLTFLVYSCHFHVECRVGFFEEQEER